MSRLGPLARRHLLVIALAVAPAACAPVYVTDPVPTVYRCGDEVFWLAFGNAHASATMPDGSLVTLERLDSEGEAEARRTFTNGRVTFVQETNGSDESRVLFARGRMMPEPCERRD